MLRAVDKKLYHLVQRLIAKAVNERFIRRFTVTSKAIGCLAAFADRKTLRPPSAIKVWIILEKAQSAFQGCVVHTASILAHGFQLLGGNEPCSRAAIAPHLGCRLVRGPVAIRPV